MQTETEPDSESLALVRTQCNLTEPKASCNEQMNGWMDRARVSYSSLFTSSLSDLFAKVPSTSSLSYFFPEPLLLVAATQQALLFLLEPNYSLCAADTLATSSCNPA